MSIELEDAYDIISEWGLNEDGFIAQHFTQSLAGNGSPDDNSIELSDLYRAFLQLIIDLGLREAERMLKKSALTRFRKWIKEALWKKNISG